MVGKSDCGMGHRDAGPQRGRIVLGRLICFSYFYISSQKTGWGGMYSPQLNRLLS